MFLEKVKSEGLAHLSYIVGDGGAAAVIDPRRDCQVYVDIARREGARITHIFETHRNEDYVSGSTGLAALSGAEVYHGGELPFAYGNTVEEGDEIDMGDVRLTVLKTPGHTFESISLMLADTAASAEAVAVFTGDALFVGDVGRTDFFEDREREVAGLLYESIFGKLIPLGDEVIIYPAHGAGSVCGGGLSKREFSTIGYERKHNAALQFVAREDFVRHKMRERHYKGKWFKEMERLNLEGAPVMEVLPQPAARTVAEFREAIAGGMTVVDTRSAEAFDAAHIAGSYSLPLAMLSAYGGWFLPYGRGLGFVVEDESRLEAAVRYLVRIGYDEYFGWLAPGITGWETSGEKISKIATVTATEVVDRLKKKQSFTLLDVRSAQEYERGHLPGAYNVYVGEVEDALGEIPGRRPLVTFCGSGARANIASSALVRAGVSDVETCLGSMEACRAVGCPIVTD